MGIAGLGQMASPVQTCWIILQLLMQGLENPFVSPEQVLWNHMQRLYKAVASEHPTISDHPRFKAFVSRTHEALQRSAQQVAGPAWPVGSTGENDKEITTSHREGRENPEETTSHRTGRENPEEIEKQPADPTQAMGTKLHLPMSFQAMPGSGPDTTGPPHTPTHVGDGIEAFRNRRTQPASLAAGKHEHDAHGSHALPILDAQVLPNLTKPDDTPVPLDKINAPILDSSMRVLDTHESNGDRDHEEPTNDSTHEHGHEHDDSTHTHDIAGSTSNQLCHAHGSVEPAVEHVETCPQEPVLCNVSHDNKECNANAIAALPTSGDVHMAASPMRDPPGDHDMEGFSQEMLAHVEKLEESSDHVNLSATHTIHVIHEDTMCPVVIRVPQSATVGSIVVAESKIAGLTRPVRANTSIGTMIRSSVLAGNERQPQPTHRGGRVFA